MHEPPINIAKATCRRDPQLAKQKPSWFIGKWAKIGFQYKKKDPECIEWMWVHVESATATTCTGTLDNDPIRFCPRKLKDGDSVTFSPDEVAEVLTLDEE